MANVKELVNVLIPDFLIKMLRKRRITIKSFAYGNNEKVAEDIQHKYNFNGDLLRLFTTNKGSSVHKWHHFIPLYERYFSPYRGKEIKFLEEYPLFILVNRRKSSVKP